VQQWVRHYCAATAASSAALAEVQQVRVPTRLSPHQQPLSMHLLTTAPAVPHRCCACRRAARAGRGPRPLRRHRPAGRSPRAPWEIAGDCR
jgi:hypothetical protein